ncbi:transposase family protein [Adhaeribacter radiodurans]|uniref:Transposase family protein n=2 Tax=Adhaeribacter radiodurans TaxID=2745197 RepID=A0A7L7L5V7_9BACT|nr:integrase core domain-containing protein [Adhaeribacter radiodurans]QMU28144.1 transposase family protein [Adhaeribacter radiodurans]
MALPHLNRREGMQLIHHSDRGLQYCSREYIQVLESYDIQISMTQNGDPLENPIAERINGILKQEYLGHQKSILSFKRSGCWSKRYFSTTTSDPISSCDMLAPDQAHHQPMQLKRRWRNYYNKKYLATLTSNVKQEEPIMVNLSKD